jgi:homoserine O-succinyltransferase/O-acetyltransferase
MPVLLERTPQGNGLQPSSGFGPADAGWVEIALINNMPDAALESTERQFLELLDGAAKHISVRLRLFSLPDVPRSDAAQRYLKSAYCGIAELWDAHLDGIIVTGTEPRAPSLRNEPYWPTLTRIVDWAEENTSGSVWSCLAAHAAVLHRDDVDRRALSGKRFGLFDCTKVADHRLMDAVPSRLRIAHSRWNELPEDGLRSRGYTILTHSPEAGVDMFAKQGKSLALFFQGHPEYDERALLREYRRDVGRYLRGERESYPAMPHGYFDRNAERVLAAFRARALADRRADLIAGFPSTAAEAGVMPGNNAAATRVYANWLDHLASQRAQSYGTRTRAAGPRGRRAAVAVSTEVLG